MKTAAHMEIFPLAIERGAILQMLGGSHVKDEKLVDEMKRNIGRHSWGMARRVYILSTCTFTSSFLK